MYKEVYVLRYYHYSYYSSCHSCNCYTNSLESYKMMRKQDDLLDILPTDYIYWILQSIKLHNASDPLIINSMLQKIYMRFNHITTLHNHYTFVFEKPFFATQLFFLSQYPYQFNSIFVFFHIQVIVFWFFSHTIELLSLLVLYSLILSLHFWQ